MTRRNARIIKSTLTNLELGQIVRERDADLKEHGPNTERTVFGLWQFGQGGTSTTTYDTPPHPITAKEKYRR